MSPAMEPKFGFFFSAIIYYECTKTTKLFRNSLGVDADTVFENHQKSRILHGERSELRLHFELTKVNQNCQKLVENVQIEKLTNETFCVIFKHCGAEQKKKQQSRVVC